MGRILFCDWGEYAIWLYVLTTYRGQLPHNHETMSLQLYNGLALFDKNNSCWISAGVITDQVLFNIVQLVFKVQIQIYKRENWNIIHGQNRKCYCISIKAWWNTNCSSLFVFYKNRFFFAGCLCLMKHALTGTSRYNEHPDLFMVAACGLGHKRFLLFSILIVQAVSSPTQINSSKCSVCDVKHAS